MGAYVRGQGKQRFMLELVRGAEADFLEPLYLLDIS